VTDLWTFGGSPSPSRVSRQPTDDSNISPQAQQYPILPNRYISTPLNCYRLDKRETNIPATAGGLYRAGIDFAPWRNRNPGRATANKVWEMAKHIFDVKHQENFIISLLPYFITSFCEYQPANSTVYRNTIQLKCSSLWQTKTELFERRTLNWDRPKRIEIITVTKMLHRGHEYRDRNRGVGTTWFRHG